MAYAAYVKTHIFFCRTCHIHKFHLSFRELNITRNLGEPFENWSYQKLDETNRVAKIIKERVGI